MASPPAASVAAMISAARGCFAPWAEKAMISGSLPLSRASVRILRPSARNSPSARRVFLSRSERSSLTVELEKAVTSRGIRPPCVGSVVLDKPPACLRASLLPKALLDERHQLRQRLVRAVALDVDDDAVA